ncbi:MAG: hypothetical protein Q8J99_17320 [Sulfuritalea sp.]|nr:hypothetical protein [Sulfuritalea sp.]
MNRILLLLHILAVVVWIGGMFFAHFCLRPAAAEQLPPAQRLPLLVGVLGRFFTAVSVALVVLWGSGTILFANPGPLAPTNWFAMTGVAGAMTVLFLVIMFRFFPGMKRAVIAQDWQAAGAAMDTIRVLVLINLLLGFLTIAIAVV